MIDHTPSSSTETPVAEAWRAEGPVRTIELGDAFAATGQGRAGAQDEPLVQWGRCGFVPSSMAHEPRVQE